jgi:uncharacterized protein with FMN-binding domain
VRVATAVGTVGAATVVLLTSWHAGEQGSPPTAGVHVIATAPPAVSTPSARGGSSTRRSARSASSSAQASAERQVTGALVGTRYGTVQVRVVIVGTHIRDVIAVHLTDSSDTSVQISAQAAPTLRQEALSAQSAKIDLVSGATFTSEGYKQSLQAAIDAAHL